MILLDLMEWSDKIDVIRFQEEFKEPRAHIVEDVDLHSLLDNPERPTDHCIQNDETVLSNGEVVNEKKLFPYNSS